MARLAARRGTLVSIASVAICLVFAGAAAGAVGGLDSSFSGDGKAVTDFTSRHDWASAVVVQPDGAILVAGESGYGRGARFGVARYRTDGTLDPSFGGDGKVRTDLTNGIDFAYDMALQADGKIVVAGEAGYLMSNPRIGVVRYNTDGTLDASFGGGDGMVITDVTRREDWGDGVSIEADGKIVVGGGCGYTSDTGTVCAIRYNPDGSLDSAFGVGGQKRIDITPVRDWANSVTLQTDGKIVLAGESGFGTRNPKFVLVRLDGDGVPDPTFSGDGIRTVDVTGYHDAALAVQIQADGKIVAAGGAGWTRVRPGRFAAVRLNADGSLDPAFSGDGMLTAAMPFRNSGANGLAVQLDGRLILAGYAGGQIAVARFNADGTLDSSFGGDGRRTTAVTAKGDSGNAVALQADGKILVAAEVGYNLANGNEKMAVLRYLGS
jgi:uncharacterized delta-60 repeat protein